MWWRVVPLRQFSENGHFNVNLPLPKGAGFTFPRCVLNWQSLIRVCNFAVVRITKPQISETGTT